mgnify:CR=1 FL=1
MAVFFSLSRLQAGRLAARGVDPDCEKGRVRIRKLSVLSFLKNRAFLTVKSKEVMKSFIRLHTGCVGCG